MSNFETKIIFILNLTFLFIYKIHFFSENKKFKRKKTENIMSSRESFDLSLSFFISLCVSQFLLFFTYRDAMSIQFCIYSKSRLEKYVNTEEQKEKASKNKRPLFQM